MLKLLTADTVPCVMPREGPALTQKIKMTLDQN